MSNNTDDLKLLDKLCDESRAIEKRIGVVAARLVLAKMDEHGVDEFRLDDENGDDFNYVIHDDPDTEDETLDDLVGWIPTRIVYNEGGRRGPWNPKLRRADLEAHINNNEEVTK